MLTEQIVKRCDAENNPSTLYIFTDNTDRTSGKNLISPDSWYSKKYGVGHCYPIVTTAVLRGLDNARPISTQRWYHKGAKGVYGRWNDTDIEIFKNVIDDEFKDIELALSSGKFNSIYFCSSIVNGHVSEITNKRTPVLYNYLLNKLDSLMLKYFRKHYVIQK